MVVRNEKCRVVGFVDLGKVHDNMEKLAGKDYNILLIVLKNKFLPNTQLNVNSIFFCQLLKVPIN